MARAPSQQAQQAGKLKLAPQKGRLPTLQFCAPAELQIDASYQRSLDAGADLIRKIACGWDWDLCQPLVVSRRDDGGLFVIDGQHRLAAARMRGDIQQLPCVIVNYASAAQEAANFVALNQMRRPLSKLDIFKAAVASGDRTAQAIQAAIEDAGLMLANHTNVVTWKPAWIANIGGIERAWRVHGQAVVREALDMMSEAFLGQVLQYAGTIFPGIVAVVADEMKAGDPIPAEMRGLMVEMIGADTQLVWRNKINLERAADPNLNFSRAAAALMRREWAEVLDAFFGDDD